MMINKHCNGCEYKYSLSHTDICTLGSPCPNQKTVTTLEEHINTLDAEQKAILLANLAGNTTNTD